MKDTQANRILAHLQSGQPLTPIEALNTYRCFRLAARVDELKRAGHPIRSEIVKRGKVRYASYSL